MKDTTITVVDSDSCNKLIGTDLPFILVLHRGENIIESILKCAQIMNMTGASFSGLGAVENPTIAYYNLATKEYQNKNFNGIYEIISLNGNIAQADGSHVAHIHIALGDDKHNVIGGHLSHGVVGVTAEITIIPLQGLVNRKFNPEIGLKLISPE